VLAWATAWNRCGWRRFYIGTKPERAFVIYSSGERDLTSGTRRRRSPIIHTGCSCRRRPTIYKYIRVCVGGWVRVYQFLVSAMGGRGGIGNAAVFPRTTRYLPPPFAAGCFDAYNVLYTASAGRRVQFPDLQSDDDHLSPAAAIHVHVYNTRSKLHTHYTQQIDTRPPLHHHSRPRTFAVRSHFRLPNDRFSTIYYYV